MLPLVVVVENVLDKLGDTDLTPNFVEDKDVMFRGFSFTVGVFFRLLRLAPFKLRAGEVLADEGADLEPPPVAPEPVLVTEMLGDTDRPEGV